MLKYIDEYRNAADIKKVVSAIEHTITRQWTIMEICGGQTHSIVRHGIDQLLPEHITLVHGPGCPVCVTSEDMIDHAIHIASLDDTIVTTFGDMARVPGSDIDLLTAKARGGDVRMVYSPLDALRIARENPSKQTVFFAVGFETTTPATALALQTAKATNLTGFSVLVAHVRVPPAMTTILSAPQCSIQGFLAAGHVCTITGTQEYVPLAERFKIPIVVTGFEPLDIVQGILKVVTQLERGQYGLDNQYVRAVTTTGNEVAKELMNRVFVPFDQQWRGIGSIPKGGLKLTGEYANFDASTRFPLTKLPRACTHTENTPCIAGRILTGQSRPHECAQFGKRCTPDHPLGAPMVSSEGACAAYYKYRARQTDKAHQAH